MLRTTHQIDMNGLCNNFDLIVATSKEFGNGKLLNENPFIKFRFKLDSHFIYMKFDFLCNYAYHSPNKTMYN